MSLSCLLYSSVGGEIQSLAWDPTGERLAVILKGLAFTLFNLINPINKFVVFLLEVVIYQHPAYFFLSGDPKAAERPAIIAVFKTRASPIFELLPWFVLSDLCCSNAFSSLALLFVHSRFNTALCICLVVLFKGSLEPSHVSCSSTQISSTELCSQW